MSRKAMRVLGTFSIAVALIVCSLVSPAHAQGEDDETPTSQETTGATPGFLQQETTTVGSVDDTVSMTQAVINVAIALAVVLGLILLLAYVMKRISHRLRTTGGGSIKVLAQIPLGPTQFLSVVEIAGEVLVLGVTEHSVTALSEIEDPAAITRLREQPSPQIGGGMLGGVTSFRQLLGKAQRGDTN